MGLETLAVESDNGYIGGEYCHEFVVLSEAGESRFLTDEKGYAAHEDVALFTPVKVDQTGEKLKPMEEVEGVKIIGVEELAEFLKIPVEITTKTILFETEKGVIAAAVRGGYDINEAKLKKVAEVYKLELASAEIVKKMTGAEVGYAGTINLPKEVKVFYDLTTANRINFEMGANKTNYHSINVNFGRDIPYPEKFYDFATAREGDMGPNNLPLVAKKGIEVGNIFQLGHHYSSKMKDATFIDAEGKEQPYYMGCYGIGLARTLATIAEVSNDEKGIIWPDSVAPYKVHLVGLDLDDAEIKSKAEEVYKQLNSAGIEVLYDDRNARAGEKFADADLIGIPWRVVVSRKTGDKIEVKKRAEKETEFKTLEEFIKDF
jgi:prolyl-tRNA synthetase